MTKLLFFLSMIMYSCHNYASQENIHKPSYRDVTIQRPNQEAMSESLLLIDLYPKVITYAASHGIYAPKTDKLAKLPIKTTVKKAKQTIGNLFRVNKYFKTFMMNNVAHPCFSDKLIKNFASDHQWSQESITRLLRTQQSKSRITLQTKLKALCCSPEYNNQLEQKLKNLITGGVDLDFTYNHRTIEKTPLMITMSYDNGMFDLLLKYVNINETNSMGLSPLHLAVTSDPINENYCMRLITHPEININQQNIHGETALLYSLIHTPRMRTNRLFAKIIQAMLNNGADPKLGNNNGITSLKKAKKLGNNRIVAMIQRVLNAKHALKL